MPKSSRYSKTKETNWTDKTIQYPRLLAEIRAIGLTKKQYEFLNESMDLSVDEIDEVLELAESDWQTILRTTPSPLTVQKYPIQSLHTPTKEHQMPTTNELDRAIKGLDLLAENGSKPLQFLVNYLKANVDDIKDAYQDT